MPKKRSPNELYQLALKKAYENKMQEAKIYFLNCLSLNHEYLSKLFLALYKQILKNDYLKIRNLIELILISNDIQAKKDIYFLFFFLNKVGLLNKRIVVNYENVKQESKINYLGIPNEIKLLIFNGYYLEAVFLLERSADNLYSSLIANLIKKELLSNEENDKLNKVLDDSETNAFIVK